MPLEKTDKTFDKTRVILAGVTSEAKKANDSYWNLFLVMDSPDQHPVLKAGLVIPGLGMVGIPSVPGDVVCHYLSSLLDKT